MINYSKLHNYSKEQKAALISSGMNMTGFSSDDVQKNVDLYVKPDAITGAATATGVPESMMTGYKAPVEAPASTGAGAASLGITPTKRGRSRTQTAFGGVMSTMANTARTRVLGA